MRAMLYPTCELSQTSKTSGSMDNKLQNRSLTSDWELEILDKWGIRRIHGMEYKPETLLWTTRCCKTKRDQALGRPKDFYVSHPVLFFCNLMERTKLRYGILSDRYGLHLDCEELEWYDIHPTSLSTKDKERLGKLIRQKALLMGFDSIAFYSNTPLMSVPYFEMLYYSRLNTWYTTRLNLLTGYPIWEDTNTTEVTTYMETGLTTRNSNKWWYWIGEKKTWT